MSDKTKTDKSKKKKAAAKGMADIQEPTLDAPAGTNTPIWARFTGKACADPEPSTYALQKGL